tara:strand:+ start:566 stop:802 length:237 start_codon:yes stop_codon:yes gene_type:complete
MTIQKLNSYQAKNITKYNELTRLGQHKKALKIADQNRVLFEDAAQFWCDRAGESAYQCIRIKDIEDLLDGNEYWTLSV